MVGPLTGRGRHDDAGDDHLQPRLPRSRPHQHQRRPDGHRGGTRRGRLHHGRHQQSESLRFPARMHHQQHRRQRKRGQSIQESRHNTRRQRTCDPRKGQPGRHNPRRGSREHQHRSLHRRRPRKRQGRRYPRCPPAELEPVPERGLVELTSRGAQEIPHRPLPGRHPTPRRTPSGGSRPGQSTCARRIRRCQRQGTSRGSQGCQAGCRRGTTGLRHSRQKVCKR